MLPTYAFQSLTRVIVAYGISLVFSMLYAYIAYRAAFAAQMLLLIIDVLQSVPILAFVPAAVLGLIAMFPGQRLGVELAAILLLFTSMAWNMLLGFYQSLISIPPDLTEAARVLRLSAWRRFWLLEAPAGICSLVWNSIISVSSGWFFLISIESFSLGPGREYRLPGLGSYLAEAADRGDMGAVSAGLLAVLGLIVCIDFLVWRPLIVWSERFKFSANANTNVGVISTFRKGASRNASTSSPTLRASASPEMESSVSNRATSSRRPFRVLELLQKQNTTDPAHSVTILDNSRGIDDDPTPLAEQGVIQQRELDAPHSIVFAYFQRSPLMRALHQRFCLPLWQNFLDADRLWEHTTRATSNTFVLAWKRVNQPQLLLRLWNLIVHLMTVFSVLLAAGAAFFSFRVANYALKVLRTISLQSWVTIFGCAMLTFGRVLMALILSLLWTVPLGVAIGCSPALARILQPVVQIAASVPATAVFPFLLLGLANLGGLGLQVGSILLMMLGTMWYVLFNVIAGSAAIPTELWEADAVYNKATSPWPVRQWRRWRYLILPGIFPYLITGIVTAVGGAWNASIVSEYVQFRGKTLSTRGLGALISDAAARGDMPMLLAGTLVMAGLVLLTNRFVWAPLYKLARERYTLN
jgi:ABC-type anion transport system duplicated permease subunit